MAILPICHNETKSEWWLCVNGIVSISGISCKRLQNFVYVEALLSCLYIEQRTYLSGPICVASYLIIFP